MHREESKEQDTIRFVSNYTTGNVPDVYDPAEKPRLSDVDSVSVAWTINQTGFDDIAKNISKFTTTERILNDRIRRTRIAKVGFGILTAVSITLAVEGFHDSIRTHNQHRPIELTIWDATDCYSDPAGTLQGMHIVGRESVAVDDPSTQRCLWEMAIIKEAALESSESYESVKPYVDEMSQVVTDLYNLSEQPGVSAPQELVAKQVEVQREIYQHDNNSFNKLLQGFGMLWVSYMLGMQFIDKITTGRIRNKALALLKDHSEYRLQDIKTALEAERIARFSRDAELPVHTLRFIKCEQVGRITFLPLSNMEIGAQIKRRYVINELLKTINTADKHDDNGTGIVGI